MYNNNVSDLCTLSSWLKALKDNTNKRVRNEYIKLMTLALKHSKPMCPFKDAPPETIDPLENGVITINEFLVYRTYSLYLKYKISTLGNRNVEEIFKQRGHSNLHWRK